MKESIINYLKEHGKSSVNDIAQALNHAGGEKFPQLIKAMSAMESKGQLRFNRDGSVSLRPKKENPNQVTVEGIFRANKNGFGFLHVDDSEDDMFIGRNDVGHAIDGDTVAVVIKKPADRLRGTAAEARVVEIVERSLKTVVGKFILSDEKEPYAGYIKSKNQKIQQPIYIKKEPVALDGTEIIKVDIEKYPNRHYDYFVGSVRDIIGHQGDAGIDVLEVLESMDIVSEFPEDVMAEAEAVPDAPSQEDLVGRVDLRQEVTFTIDGADAKDLDDAVHIKRLPNGYDTYIKGDDGSLSQGEKQLLCIARLMLALPPMLILDEATSSIDTRTEMKIQEAFQTMMEGRTTFVVAHRLSTIREADVILYMQDGKVLEQGNHQELLEKNGYYAKLYRSQFVCGK